MDTFEDLCRNARRNEEISRNLFEIEVAILNISTAQAFFEHLVQQVIKKFAVPFVSITLIRNGLTEVLCAALKRSETLEGMWTTVPQIEFLAATQGIRRPILRRGQDLQRLIRLLPASHRSKTGSLALLPLQMDGHAIGSLNLADPSDGRYDPSMDNYFLYQLGVKASLCLSAVVARERADFLATRDPLTQLRNRRELDDALSRELGRVRRQRSALSLLFVDCDDFKQINDRYGHDVGDQYLRHLAVCMEAAIRMTDSAYRYAGDEFVLLLPDQDVAGAEYTIDRLRSHFEANPLRVHGHVIPLRASFGLAATSGPVIQDARTLLKNADADLYRSKRLKRSPEVPATLATDGSTESASKPSGAAVCGTGVV